MKKSMESFKDLKKEYKNKYMLLLYITKAYDLGILIECEQNSAHILT
jgi:hypothetical protein